MLSPACGQLWVSNDQHHSTKTHYALMCAPPQEQRPGGEDGANTGLLMSFRHMFAESRCSETELYA